MRKSIVAIAILAFFAFSLVPAFAGDSCCPSKAKAASVKKTEILCPVTGDKIASVSKAAGKSAYKGKTYYFCCPSCKTKFDKDPEKYIKVNAKGKASCTCSMADKKKCCDKNGANCKCPCDGVKNGKCSMTAAKKPAKKTVSAVCPVMGSKIPDVSKASGKSVYKGKTYYFCCDGCKPMFDKNPEKYIKK